ncbi:MAG: PAS domain S-box protein [Microscillaceae bacterium]|nr:PAS domain S-box protein [Microscillaceae bacterium]
MFNRSSDITSDFIEKLNVTKTLYSKFDSAAEKSVSEVLIREALEDVYKRGNSILTGFLILHFFLGLSFVYFFEASWGIYLSIGTSILVLFFLCEYYYPYKFLTRVFAGVSLLIFVLLYIIILRGYPEARFFFFTSFTILIVYQDWKALWPSALLFLIQIVFFALAASYPKFLPDYIPHEYKDAILNMVTDDSQGILLAHFKTKLMLYVGIICLQVTLTGLWAHFLRRQTISEVLDKQSLLTKQIEIEQANTQLEDNVRKKTRELQEALESTQANEEELRQNMEELHATQEEMENQRKILLENQKLMKAVEIELRERQSKMERSQWLESNLSRFDDVMRLNYDKNLEDFSDIIMLHLAELMGATQGAFYVYDEENDSLNMTGGYACTPQSVKKAQFRSGEGVLGQIIKTKKRIELNDLPDESAYIESALTKVKNKSVIIEPLLYNEDVQGVIEIALLSSLDDIQLEFLKRLAKNIASMLQSIRGILRTQKLLVQSQDIASKFQSNARELEKTKLEVEKKAFEFQSQFKAIDRSMLVIECSVEGDILRANENFLKLSKYNLDELEGKHQSIFLDENYVKSTAFNQLWDQIQKNDFAHTEHQCLNKLGNFFWIQANYYSLGLGKNKKVMILAYDITLQKEQDRKIRDSLKMLQEKELILRKNLEITKELREEVSKKANELQEQMNAINVSTAMAEYDGSGIIQLVNDKFSEILGYHKEELLGQSHKILVKNKFAQSKSYQKLWDKLRSKQFIDGDFEFVNKSGAVVWLQGSYYPVTDKEGNLVKVLQLASDISNEIYQEEKIKDYLIELEKKQSQLQNQTDELRAYLEAIDQATGIIEMDPEGKILRTNEKFLKLLNYTNRELLGKHHRILVPKDYAQTQAYRSFWNKLDQQKIIEGEFIGITGNASEIKIWSTYVPVLGTNKRVDKVIGLVAPLIQK